MSDSEDDAFRERMSDVMEKSLLDAMHSKSDRDPLYRDAMHRIEEVAGRIVNREVEEEAEDEPIDDSSRTADPTEDASATVVEISKIFDTADELKAAIRLALNRKIISLSLPQYNDQLLKNMDKAAEIDNLTKINRWRMMRSKIIFTLYINVKVLADQQQKKDDTGGSDDTIIDSKSSFNISNVRTLLAHIFQCVSMKSDVDDDSKFTCYTCEAATRMRNTHCMTFVGAPDTARRSHTYFLCGTCNEAFGAVFSLVYHFDTPVTQGMHALNEWRAEQRRLRPDRKIPFSEVNAYTKRTVTGEIVKQTFQNVQVVLDKLGMFFIHPISSMQATRMADILIDMYDPTDPRRFIGIQEEDIDLIGEQTFDNTLQAINTLNERIHDLRIADPPCGDESPKAGEDVEIVTPRRKKTPAAGGKTQSSSTPEKQPKAPRKNKRSDASDTRPSKRAKSKSESTKRNE